MIIERTKNTKRNIIWGVLNKVIHMLFPFAIRTIIINKIGVEYLGINNLFSSILTVLSLSELGFDSAVVFLMYDAVAKDDIQRINALQAFLRKVYIYVGFSILSLGLLCMPFLPYLIKDISAVPGDVNIYHIFVIFLFNSSFSYLFGGYKSTLFAAYHRSDLTSKINVCMFILASVLQIMCLAAFRSFYAYIYLMPLSTVLTNRIMVYGANRNFPEIKPNGNISKEEKAVLKKMIYGTTISRVGSILTTTIDSIIVSAFLGITILAYYSNYQYIITALIGVLYILYSSLQGAIGNSIVIDSIEKNYKDLKTLTFIYNWIIGFIFFCLCFLMQPFMLLWIGQDGVLSNSLMYLMAVYLYVSEAFGVLGAYKGALGIVWEDRYRQLVSGLANILIKSTLLTFFVKSSENASLLVIVCSSVLCVGLINLPWSAYVTFKKYFKHGMKEYFIQQFLCLFIAILCVCIANPLFKFIDTIPCSVYIIFVIKIIACLIMPNILFFLFYHRTKQFYYAKEFILYKILK
jgi:O-antigen/teichoic acid export membrane protein